MNETLKLLSQALPQLAIIAAVCGFIGWSLRGRSQKPAEAAAPKTKVSEKGADRAKNLEAALEKAKAEKKAVKSELEQLQASSVRVADFEAVTAQLEAARQASDSDAKRVSALEADLKKAQETIRNLNARTNEVAKAQKDRSFALENELSKVRQELALLQERPDDTTGLLAEIERLRESVAVSTRYAGEIRKREAAAVEALEKAQAQLAELSDPSRPSSTAVKKVGPVADSGRIAAAKAEVLRILELNKQRSGEAPSPEPESADAAETPVAEIALPPVEVAPALQS